jgi:hypothetical protein
LDPRDASSGREPKDRKEDEADKNARRDRGVNGEIAALYPNVAGKPTSPSRAIHGQVRPTAAMARLIMIKKRDMSCVSVKTQSVGPVSTEVV